MEILAYCIQWLLENKIPIFRWALSITHKFSQALIKFWVYWRMFTWIGYLYMIGNFYNLKNDSKHNQPDSLHPQLRFPSPRLPSNLWANSLRFRFSAEIDLSFWGWQLALNLVRRYRDEDLRKQWLWLRRKATDQYLRNEQVGFVKGWPTSGLPTEFDGCSCIWASELNFYFSPRDNPYF